MDDHTRGGWIDLDARVLHRRPTGAIETAKRRLAIPIPDRLLPHLRRWRRLTARYVIEWQGKPLAGQLRRAWRRARERAGLNGGATPHVLCPTCSTWLLPRSISIYHVARVLDPARRSSRRPTGIKCRITCGALWRAFATAVDPWFPRSPDYKFPFRYDIASSTMTRDRLNKLRRELASLRKGSHKAKAFQDLARKLGRKQNTKRGKEPMWESQPFDDLFPLAIPDHGSGKDISPGTQRSILNLLESDVARWEELLDDQDSDVTDGDDVE